MAEAAVTKLARVRASPTTVQYQKIKRYNPYIPKFNLSKENWHKTLAQSWLSETDPLMPPYPYGANVNYPEANYGLYGGASIQSGNKISKGRNKGKTLRKWYPNVRFEKIRSEALGKVLKIPIRARVMRTIRKCGGLDQYLIGDKPARIKELGLLGWKLRYLVMKSPKMQEEFKLERRRLGLPEEDPLTQTFADVWNNERLRQQLIAQQDKAWENLRIKLENWDRHANEQWDKEAEDDKAPKDEPYSTTRGATIELLPSQMDLPEVIEEEAEIRSVRRPRHRK
jgi:large subunit ribosomal protein L28